MRLRCCCSSLKSIFLHLSTTSNISIFLLSKYHVGYVLDHLPNAHPRYLAPSTASISLFSNQNFLFGYFYPCGRYSCIPESILSIVPGIDGDASETLETETLIGSIMHKGASIKLCPKGEMAGR